MLAAIKKHVKETLRCTRHNLLHLKTFNISYSGNDRWRARGLGVDLIFPYYPYLPFFDIEGYLQGGAAPGPGMTVIDAGGCDGEFTLLASKLVGPSGRVLMLEPDGINAARARKLFELNGNPANITIVPAGLWKNDDGVRFGAGHDGQSAVLDVADSKQASGASMGPVHEIATYSLPSLISTFGLTRLDYIKMDIEGAELEAMSRASEMPFRPRYAIASYHIVDGKPTKIALENLFAEMNYASASGYPTHVTTWASPR